MRNKFKALLLLPLFSFVLSGCNVKDVVSKIFPKSHDVPAEVVEEDKKEEEQKPSESEVPETPEEPVEPEIEQAVFPAKEVISFFESSGLDVVVTSYSSSNLEVVYEIDDSVEGYFDVYVTGSSHEEMEAYKDACIADGWAVIGENEGDYRLQFGETNACVDLIDFEDYIGVSFFVKEEAPTGMSPEEALSSISAYFGGSVSEVQEGVFGTYGAFSASTYSVEDMKGYVSNLFVPEEFELINDWSEAEDGTNSCMYANAVLTVLECYVYGETLYVDADGYIVDESTEGATAVEATCVEIYSYTYSAE